MSCAASTGSRPRTRPHVACRHYGIATPCSPPAHGRRARGRKSPPGWRDARCAHRRAGGPGRPGRAGRGPCSMPASRCASCPDRPAVIATVVSGLDTAAFTFAGFLPTKPGARDARLKDFGPAPDVRRVRGAASPARRRGALGFRPGATSRLSRLTKLHRRAGTAGAILAGPRPGTGGRMGARHRQCAASLPLRCAAR